MIRLHLKGGSRPTIRHLSRRCLLRPTSARSATTIQTSAPFASVWSSNSSSSAPFSARRDGKIYLNDEYAAFVKKFSPELASNAAELKSLVKRKHANLDVMVTEIANRTAQRPVHDHDFCSRHQRAFEWALLGEVTSLTQVPAPYDLGPEMKVFPCPKG